MECGSTNPETLPDGTHRVESASGHRSFVKVRRAAPEDFFRAEAAGLAALARIGAMRVPQIFEVWPGGIALEDLGSGRASRGDFERGGRALAQLHRASGKRFGFDSPGYCGDSPQDNTWEADGFRWFAERRLLPQARRAVDAARLVQADALRVESMCRRLPELLPPQPPVLVHGDLWLGNLHACTGGELALIDGGAVHHGWAEADLAMLTLFGAPPETFFSAYQAEAGRGSDWRKRAPVFNLYHLLNHLNLFSASYLAPVRDVLAQFA